MKSKLKNTVVDFWQQKTYQYDYDGLNRLRNATFEGNSQNYSMNLTYDQNGNILTMNRYGKLPNNSFDKIDQLTYNYANNGKSNQLIKVDDQNNTNQQALGFSDKGSFNPTEYYYDPNGNLTKDRNKQIVKIDYNYMNLPRKITFTYFNRIEFKYTANGTKLQKQTYKTGNLATTTDYIGNFIYENQELKYIQTSYGRIVCENNKYERQYFMKDHLGNTAIVFDTKAEVLQEDSYYPFGMNIKELSYTNSQLTITDTRNNFLYNGKELQQDFGLEWLDYGARMLDPVLCRWFAIDAMADNYFSYSPYNYVRNNPILRIDPNGMWDDNITVNSEGFVTNVVETDETNKFYDEEGNQLILNDAEIADNFLTSHEFFTEGDRLYYPLSKSEVKTAIVNVGISDNWLETAYDSYFDADFAYSFLAPIVAKDQGISLKEDYTDKGELYPEQLGYFKVEGYSSIYNLYDAGNFMWGGWMQMNNYSLDKTLDAADWNSILTGYGDDSMEDQRAIKNGYMFYFWNYGKNDK